MCPRGRSSCIRPACLSALLGNVAYRVIWGWIELSRLIQVCIGLYRVIITWGYIGLSRVIQVYIGLYGVI